MKNCSWPFLRFRTGKLTFRNVMYIVAIRVTLYQVSLSPIFQFSFLIYLSTWMIKKNLKNLLIIAIYINWINSRWKFIVGKCLLNSLGKTENFHLECFKFLGIHISSKLFSLSFTIENRTDSLRDIFTRCAERLTGKYRNSQILDHIFTNFKIHFPFPFFSLLFPQPVDVKSDTFNWRESLRFVWWLIVLSGLLSIIACHSLVTRGVSRVPSRKSHNYYLRL